MKKTAFTLAFLVAWMFMTPATAWTYRKHEGRQADFGEV